MTNEIRQISEVKNRSAPNEVEMWQMLSTAGITGISMHDASILIIIRSPVFGARILESNHHR